MNRKIIITLLLAFAMLSTAKAADTGLLGVRAPQPNDAPEAKAAILEEKLVVEKNALPTATPPV